MILRRLKNLWSWSLVEPVTIEKTHIEGVYKAVDKRLEIGKTATIIPYKKRDPVAEIVSQLPENQQEI